MKNLSFFNLLLIFLITSCSDNEIISNNPILSELACGNLKKFNSNKEQYPKQKTRGLTVAESSILKNAYYKQNPTQEMVDHLYTVFEIVDELLREKQIPYSIICGTLIGALRNGGLVPNDDDIDIGILKKYRQNIEELSEVLKSKGYLFKKVYYGYKIVKNDGKLNRIGLDIFIFDNFKVTCPDNRKVVVLHYEAKRARKRWPLEFFPNVSDFNPKNIVDIKFGNLKVQSVGLKSALLNLENSFGSDWYNVAYKIVDHGITGAIIQKKFDLSLEDYYFLVPGPQI